MLACSSSFGHWEPPPLINLQSRGGKKQPSKPWESMPSRAPSSCLGSCFLLILGAHINVNVTSKGLMACPRVGPGRRHSGTVESFCSRESEVKISGLVAFSCQVYNNSGLNLTSPSDLWLNDKVLVHLVSWITQSVGIQFFESYVRVTHDVAVQDHMRSYSNVQWYRVCSDRVPYIVGYHTFKTIDHFCQWGHTKTQITPCSTVMCGWNEAEWGRLRAAVRTRTFRIHIISYLGESFGSFRIRHLWSEARSITETIFNELDSASWLN